MIGEVLKAWRWKHELGQAAAANKLGITTSVLSNIEAGKSVSGETMLVLIWVLFSRKDAP